MKNRIASIIEHLVTGDALGTNYEGLSRGHVSAVFKEVKVFQDPEPALKGKLIRWRMPGLYSSISQMGLLHASLLASGSDVARIRDMIAGSPEPAGSDYGIFRNPGRCEQELITNCRSGDPAGLPQSPVPCGRIIPSALPAAFFAKSPADCLALTAGYVSLFTTNPDTAAGALAASSLVFSLLSGAHANRDMIWRLYLDTLETISEEVKSRPDTLFNAGINPLSLEESLKRFRMVAEAVPGTKDIRAAEDRICEKLNPGLKTPIRRASVNLPEALVPFSAFMASRVEAGAPSAAAAAEGGMSPVLASLTAAFSAAADEEYREPPFFSDLVNRKRVAAMAAAIAAGCISISYIDDFIESESSLTRKEIEERNARLKHEKKPDKKKKKSDRQRRDDLTRHIVESWTKVDKARWKKEKMKQDLDRHEK